MKNSHSRNTLQRSLRMMMTVSSIMVFNMAMHAGGLFNDSIKDVSTTTAPLLSLAAIIALCAGLYQEKTNTTYNHTSFRFCENANWIENSLATLTLASSCFNVVLATATHKMNVMSVSMTIMFMGLISQHIIARNSFEKLPLSTVIKELKEEMIRKRMMLLHKDLLHYKYNPPTFDIASLASTIPHGTTFTITEDVTLINNDVQFWEQASWHNNEWNVILRGKNKTFTVKENETITASVFLHKLAMHTHSDINVLTKDLMNASITMHDDIYTNIALHYNITGRGIPDDNASSNVLSEMELL